MYGFAIICKVSDVLWSQLLQSAGTSTLPCFLSNSPRFQEQLHHHQENPQLPPRVDWTPALGPKPHCLWKALRSQCLGNRHRFLHALKLRKLSYVKTKQAKSEQTKALNTQHPQSLAESLHHSWSGSKCSFLIQKSLLRYWLCTDMSFQNGNWCNTMKGGQVARGTSQSGEECSCFVYH